MMYTHAPRGFTLIIAVIISSVVVSVGLALLDVTYKQVILASAATQSQYAFYNADTVLECALYWDQKIGAFDYSDPLESDSITCSNLVVTEYAVSAPAANTKRTEFSIPCQGGGSLGYVTIDKTTTGYTTIFANGYNSCESDDPRRVERGLKAFYGS